MRQTMGRGAVRSWASSIVLLAAAIAIPAMAADVKYVWAVVNISGVAASGSQQGYNKDGRVYLDVVAVPANTVIEPSTLILVDNLTRLSDIQQRALNFAKPYAAKLGIVNVRSYYIWLNTEGGEYKGLEGVQRARAKEFSVPSRHIVNEAAPGVWAGKAVGGGNTKLTQAKAPNSGPSKTLQLSQGDSPAKEAERVRKAEAAKKDRMAKNDLANNAKLSSDQASRDVVAKDKAKKLAAYCTAEGTRKLSCMCPLPPGVKVCAR